MKIHVITKQLSNKLPLENKLQNLTCINPNNFKSMCKIISSKKISELHVIDATYSTKVAAGKMIRVKDHINKTGSNILIGRQAFLNRDFIDMTNIYSLETNAIITICCGEILNKNVDYPSHFLCHITALAHALKIPTIKGFLYNTP